MSNIDWKSPSEMIQRSYIMLGVDNQGSYIFFKNRYGNSNIPLTKECMIIELENILTQLKIAYADEKLHKMKDNLNGK